MKLDFISSLGQNEQKYTSQLRYRLLAPTLSDKLKSQLGYHLLKPKQQDEIKFQDQSISISFSVREQAFGLCLTNLTPHPLKILWDRSEYTDMYVSRSRLMPSGIRYRDRNNPIPPQIVLPGSSVQETVTPIEHVFVSPKTGGYEIKPLFSRTRNATVELEGKAFMLFIPVEIDQTIIPYNFKIGIFDASQAAAKK